MKISTSNLSTSIAFTALLLGGFVIQAQATEQNVSYFDGKEDRNMSVTSSRFTPTHPDCCTKKVSLEPSIIPEQKEATLLPPPPTPEPIIEKDSDGDGVVDSIDECPNTPKGYKVDPKGCPRSVTLHINFASNSSVLPSSADSDVNVLTDFMNENPAATITIIGHTDSTGKAVKNQLLSENRAKALGSILEHNGIASERIKTSGKGLSEPIASNKKPAGRAQNRRIEIQIR
jgi:OmpA-OmpF porin, OOP family